MSKNIFVIILFSIISFFNLGCNAQKMVKTINDAKELQINEEKFIGKPLSHLLMEVAPSIKFAYGNTDNEQRQSGLYITFYFLEKKEFLKLEKEGKNPTHIRVVLKKAVDKSLYPLSKGGVEAWNPDHIKKYGGMIVQRIYVSGEN